MSENYRYENLPSDHLFAVIDHAQSQIEMWQHRQDLALGQLVCRGEVIQEYPTQT